MPAGIPRNMGPEGIIGVLLVLIVWGFVDWSIDKPTTYSTHEVVGYVTRYEQAGGNTYVEVSNTPTIQPPKIAFRGGIGGGSVVNRYHISGVVSLSVGQKIQLKLSCADRLFEAGSDCRLVND